MKTYKHSRLLFFFPIAIFIIILSCTKDPEIIIQKETITVIDTIIVIDTITVIETVIQTVPDTATTFILVRHAETTGVGSNPGLSSAGQARANELRRILGNVTLNAVYSTNLNRTMQTAEPTSSAQGLTITTYDPFAPDALIDNTLADYQEGIVLVVGHSNTTAALLNAMVGANMYSDIPETEYDNLFVVYVSERGRAKVVHMKYGE